MKYHRHQQQTRTSASTATLTSNRTMLSPAVTSMCTPAAPPTPANFIFLVAPDNNDLFVIKKRDTASKTTEVHVLSAAAGYRSWSLHSTTAIHETNEDFVFLLATNRDIYVVKRSNTGSQSTEVHVLSAASAYKRFSLSTGTAMHETDATYTFALAANLDIIIIKTQQTGSGKTEVHALSSVHNYQSFVLHSATALHEVDSSYTFQMAPNRDLYIIKRFDTGTATTEVHALSAGTNYQTYSVHAATALHECDYSYTFAMSASRDLFVIKTKNTGSGVTEVHLLDASSNFKNFILHAPTALHTISE
jgi:hypothetical protein